FTGAGLSVVPTFAAKPLLGTNPIALAAPARHEAPMLFDAATSAIAGNKIRLAMRVGSPLLPGWVTDKEGIPIMEEKPVFDRDEFYQAPLGGTREQGSHKGYGLALMAEVLSTVLSGALPTMLVAGSGSKNHFAAYNIEAFTDPEQFKDTMDQMLKTLRTAKPVLRQGHRDLPRRSIRAGSDREAPGRAQPRELPARHAWLVGNRSPRRRLGRGQGARPAAGRARRVRPVRQRRQAGRRGEDRRLGRGVSRSRAAARGRHRIHRRLPRNPLDVPRAGGIAD